MELFPAVKKYIEDNRDLLDKDDGIKELVDNFPSPLYVYNLFDALRSIGLLSDYESLLDEYIKEVKKHVIKSSTGIKIEPVIKERITSKSFPHQVYIAINNDMNPSIEIQLNNQDKLIIDDDWMFIQRGNERSLKRGMTRNASHQLYLHDLISKQNIKDVIYQCNTFVKKFDEFIVMFQNSFQYKEDATALINKVVPKLEELMTSILGYHKIIVKHDAEMGDFYVSAKSKTGTSIKLFTLYYDKPITQDETDLLTAAEPALKNYKIEYDKNQARKAAKQAELDANPNKKIITRKDVTQAIKASGVYVRDDFVYTNKHKTTTTYKYAFNDLTQDECDKIKDELVKIGAPVKNVTCEQGWWSGRGAYMSLFIRIYN